MDIYGCSMGIFIDFMRLYGDEFFSGLIGMFDWDVMVMNLSDF